MATFREWLVFEQIREDVYEKSLSRLLLQDALDKALEFCNMAVNGRWDLILESDLNDHDDGPVELADPFDGDEDAPEVQLPTSGPSPLERARIRRKKRRKKRLLPHERRGRGEERRPPREDEDSHGDEEEFHNGLRVQRIPDKPKIEKEIEADWELEPKAKEPKAEEKAKIVANAREIKRLWQMARWAAMLDRRDLVDTVRKIYDEELAPLLKGDEWGIGESVEDDDEPFDFSFLHPKKEPKAQEESEDEPFDFSFLHPKKEPEAPASTAKVPSAPTAPAKRHNPMAQSSPNATATPASPLAKKTPVRETRIYKVTERLIPLLKKLGYLRDSHLPASLTDEQRMRVVIEKARIAKEEKGNDPPSNGEGVREMEADPVGRGRHMKSAIEMLADTIKAMANRAYQRTLKGFRDADGRSREGSRHLPDEALNNKATRAMISITSRAVHEDGTAQPWSEKENAFAIDIADYDSAIHYINSLGSNMDTTLKRDADREDNKAAGLATNSDQRPIHIDAPVAGADGETSSMAGNVADPRGRTADELAGENERMMSYTEALKKALKEMAQKNESAAVMACLFLGLHGDCSPETFASEDSVEKLMAAMMNTNVSDRRKSYAPLVQAGYENMIPGGKPREQAKWEFIKLIHSLGLIGKLTGRSDPKPKDLPADEWESGKNYFHVKTPPTGDPPPEPWLPDKKSMADNTPEQDRWRNYTDSVIDNLTKHVLPPLARKIQKIISESARQIKPKGWVSSCSWRLPKFINSSFATSIKDGSIEVKEENPTGLTVIFKHKQNKNRKEIGRAEIQKTDKKINVVIKDGETEVISKEFSAPTYDQPCPECGGSSSTCEECEGCNGRSMNKVKVIGMEMEILDFINMYGSRSQSRSSPPSSKPS